MEKLQNNFEMDKYGIHVRLVNENDANFILKLRTDEKLSKFLHDTDPDLNKQINWIRQYKIRESDGLEYYFIYYKDNKPFAVNRLYNIHNKTFTGGSWICIPNYDAAEIVATTLIQMYIAFDILNFQVSDCFDGIHENNKKVLKFNKMIGLKITGAIQDTKGKYYIGTIKKKDFEVCRNRLEKLLNLK